MILDSTTHEDNDFHFSCEVIGWVDCAEDRSLEDRCEIGGAVFPVPVHSQETAVSSHKLCIKEDDVTRRDR